MMHIAFKNNKPQLFKMIFFSFPVHVPQGQVRTDLLGGFLGLLNTVMKEWKLFSYLASV